MGKGLNKCNVCGKFVSLIESAKCSKCTSLHHRICINISPDFKLPARWLCQDCKTKQESIKLCTPVKTVDHSSDVAPKPSCSTTILSLESSGESIVNEITKMRVEVMKELTSVRAEFARFNETIINLSKRIDSIEDRLGALESSREEDLHDITSNEGTQCILPTLRTELNRVEQENLVNDIEVIGIPERPGEDLTTVLTSMAEKLGVELNDRDVVSVERSWKRQMSARGAEQERPRRIVARLARRAVREQLLRAARARRGADTAGVVSGEPKRFFVYERLTYTNRVLLYKSRCEAKVTGWRFVWSRHGNIYARKDIGTKVYRLKSENDLETVFHLSPP